MTAEEILRSGERSALENNQMVSHVTGKQAALNGKGKKGSLGALAFVTAMLVVFAVLFSSGNLIPSAISERLIEETDVQYADAVESKKLVFQQAMYDGDLPENTVEILKQNGVETERAENGEIVLKIGDKIITASNFITEVNTNVNLYNAFNNATYSRAAYYYDDAAKKVFERIGTTRNNYSSESDFDEVMDSLVGSGSEVSVSNVVANENTDGSEGEDETDSSYSEIGYTVDSSEGANSFISGVGEQNLAATTDEATLNSADALKVADTISKEQRSSLFFLAFMENISKMKAGEGNESKINEAMNYLHENRETEVVDVETGEIITLKGTALESPSLYAILAGSKADAKVVNNFSSDRVLKTVENRLQSGGSNEAISGTVASSDANVKGSIGRFLSSGEENASIETLGVVDKTIDDSLVNNSYKTINGIGAGEFLVEGAVNVGKELAKASGATAGDAEAVTEYARLNSAVLAMDAAADRMNRSPLDVTSKNTFLGSVFYKLAVASSGMAGTFSGVRTFSNVVNDSIVSLAPSSKAEAAEGYLSEFGDCETYDTIGAVGSLQCTEVATFDTSTLKDIFNDPGFKEFVNNNTTLDEYGTRTINDGSVLAEFVLYNNERTTPLGTVDGGILESLNSGSESVPFVSDILGMIENFLGASEDEKRIASGAEYVNSASNPSWQTYKYAQRYVSLARATESLRQYAGDSTAYNNIYGFEGKQNPVIAFVEKYYTISRNN